MTAVAETKAQRSQTLSVSFQGMDVAVSSDVPEVVAALERIFAAMLVPASTHAVGHIRVSRNGGSYHVSGGANGDLQKGSLVDVLRHVRFSVIEALIEARPDLLWFHAGAATAMSSGFTIVLPGARGRGKSTLVTGLCGRGWTYLSDDIVPLNPSSSQVAPFPVTPARREFPGQEMPPDWLLAPTKMEIPVAPESICRQPVSVGAVVFPIYGLGASLELTRCPAAQAVVELLQHCWNFGSHRESAVRYLAGLVARLPDFRLSFSDGDQAAELVTQSCLTMEPRC
jgi:hypothetical protein